MEFQEENFTTKPKNAPFTKTRNQTEKKDSRYT